MKFDFSKLIQSSTTKSLEPRDLFLALPKRDKRYEYPRDVQSEVWKKWYDVRLEKNIIIKMNTGSGKTVVGLLILLSSLKEDAGPVAYVVPDNFLLEQVKIEAERLGVSVTDDENDPDFLRKQSILLINIHKLVNGKSIFGMRSADKNVKLTTILIDDIHACLSVIEEQFTIVYDNTEEEYKRLVQLFSPAMLAQCEGKWNEILDSKDQFNSMLVPFWTWQSKQAEIHEILQKNKESNSTVFNYPLIRDNLKFCNCVVTAKHIEITPKSVPINVISSFSQASRRIFMSATLADDSVFVHALGLKKKDMDFIITPDKANDIGDRLILYPQVNNKEITDVEIKMKLIQLSKQRNVIVIVPSIYRSKFWSPEADMILDKKNLSDGIKKLKDGKHIGLTVLINKYDGIDLPDNACRYLVIDGLPVMNTEYDLYELDVLPNSARLISDQIQKIEQGMGRGIRSNNDYCVVVLMGSKLIKIIYADNGKRFFSEATKAQFDFSEGIWKQEELHSIDKTFELADYFFERSVEWISASREVVSNVAYYNKPNVDEFVEVMRTSYDLALSNHTTSAIKAIEDYANKTEDKRLKGYIMQNLAEAINLLDSIRSQEVLKAAKLLNTSLLKPIDGIIHHHKEKKSQSQAKLLKDFVVENALDSNSYLIKMNALIEDLQFRENSYSNFEKALKELSFMIGIYSSRPENEVGLGPDNFWELDGNIDFVIECKNETTIDTISKKYCNQLNGSVQWYKTLGRPSSSKCYPILIHKSSVFDADAFPEETTRIMTPEKLRLFTDNCSAFARGFAASFRIDDYEYTTKLLDQHNLCGIRIINTYTVEYKKVKTK